jgi:hypothetical protein
VPFDPSSPYSFAAALARGLEDEEERMRDKRFYRTKDAIVNELVKSYGFEKHPDGKWGWSLGKIGQSFKEDPFWTTLDWALVVAPPASWGLAVRGVTKGTSATGKAIGVPAKALKAGALAGAVPKTRAGRAIGHIPGIGPETARAAEMYKFGPSQLVWQGKGGKIRGLSNPLTTKIDADYLDLLKSDKFGVEMYEGRAIAKVAQRELILAESTSQRIAGDTIRQWQKLGISGAGMEKAGRFLDTGIHPEDLRVVNALGQKGQEVYKNTWQFRNEMHEAGYEALLFGEATYRTNLRRYSPGIYKEYLDAQAAADKLMSLEHAAPTRKAAVPGGVGGAHARYQPRVREARQAERAGELSKLEQQHAKVTDKLRAADGADPRAVDALENRLLGIEKRMDKLTASSAASDALTQVLDPRLALHELGQVGQLIARQKYAQGLAKSVIARTPDEIATLVDDIMTNGNVKAAAMHGIRPEKVKAVEELLTTWKGVGREAEAEEIAHLLGWRKLEHLYDKDKLPKYFERLPDELKNKWLDPVATQDIVGTLQFLSSDPTMMKAFYNTTLTTFRAGKTAYNAATHVRNVFGAAVMNHLATGGVPRMVPKKGIKAYLNLDENYAAGRGYGFAGSSFDNEIREGIERGYKGRLSKDQLMGQATALDWMGDAFGDNLVTQVLRKGAGKAERFYRGIDEIYKLDAFIVNTERYQRAGHPLARARDLAAEDVNKYMANFMMHSEVADAIRGGIPFASFTTEALRVWKNAIIEKPHLAYFWNHMAEGMSQTFGAMSGFSPEQIDEGQKQLPHYMKGKKMVLLPFNVDGQPRFVDLSYLIPLANLVEVETSDRVFFGQEVIDPTTNPILNAAAALGTGRDPFSGREISPRFTERQLGIPITGQRTRKAVGLVEHMAQLMLPPLVPPGYAGVNLLEMARGLNNPATDEPLEDGVFRTIMQNVFGMRMYAPDVESQILNLKKEQRDSSKRVTQAWRRWQFARSNGDIGAMEAERERIIAIKRAAGHADPEDYFVKGIKRHAPFANLSTKNLKEVLRRAEKLGDLSPKDERIRAELLARLQSRGRKRKKKATKQ